MDGEVIGGGAIGRSSVGNIAFPFSRFVELRRWDGIVVDGDPFGCPFDKVSWIL